MVLLKFFLEVRIALNLCFHDLLHNFLIFVDFDELDIFMIVEAYCADLHSYSLLQIFGPRVIGSDTMFLAAFYGVGFRQLCTLLDQVG